MKSDLEYLKEGVDRVKEGMSSELREEGMAQLVTKLVMKYMETVLIAAGNAKLEDQLKEENIKRNT